MSKDNRTYCQSLLEVIDVDIDHTPTVMIDLLRFHLYDSAAQHREFRVWVAKLGNPVLRVVLSCGSKVPTKDLAVELLGWADVN